MRLECNQSPWLNIARTTAIKRLHPISKGPRCETVAQIVDLINLSQETTRSEKACQPTFHYSCGGIIKTCRYI
jgi:hypothetical protein